MCALSTPTDTSHDPGVLPDERLMLMLKAGNMRAFDTLVRRHTPAVTSLARHVCGPDLADEVAQAAFVSLWQHRLQYRPERGSPRSWLLAIVRNRGIDQIRSRASRQRHMVPVDPQLWLTLAGETAAAEPAHAYVERAETGAALRRLLAGLPSAQRHVVELAYIEGLSQQQIADRLAIPLGTVKGRLRLGLGKLRAAWAQPESVAAAA